MHEWGIALNIAQKIEEALKANKLARAARVEINLGKELGIKEEEFRFCIQTITKDEAPFKDTVFDIRMTDSKLASIEGIDGE